jgi:hypothetical protein
MAVAAIVKRGPRVFSIHFTFEDYVAAALTAGTNKREWVLPCQARVNGIIASSGAAGSGTGSNVIDINRNGTSIFGATGDKPALAAVDSAYWSVGSGSLARDFSEGDVMSYDVDSVGSGAGPTRTALTVAFGIL